MSACRSCEAEVLWVRTERGRRMPLDPVPVDLRTHSGTGLFVLRDEHSPEGPLALAVGGSEFPLERHYTSHFATCPQAEEWRK